MCDTSPNIPDDAAAVVVNLTAVSTTAAGYLTASALSDDAPPAVSTLNFTPGTTTSNLAVVPLGLVGCIQVHNGSTGKTHVLVDVQGYLSAGPATVNGSTQTIYPSRILDTRTKRVAIPAHSSLDVQVAGAGGVPPTNVAAAWLNLTVTGNTRAGYLTAYPTGTTRPLAANLNFGAGETRAAGTLAKVGLNGRVTVYNGSSAPAHLVVDAQGFVRSGSGASALAGVTPVAPTRLVDTRSSGPVWPGTPLAVGLNSPTRPNNSAAALVAVTATGAGAPGHLRVSSTQVGDNATSMVNFVPGRATTNLVVARASEDLAISNGSTQPVHVVVDVVGWVNPERAVSGQVTASDGTTLVNSPVATSKSLNSYVALTGSDGRFDRALAPGVSTVQLCARSPLKNGVPTYDYAPSCTESWDNPRTFVLGLGQAVSAAIVLDPAGTVSGTAVDHTGATLTSGEVTLRRLSDGRATAATVSNGVWTARAVPAGDYFAYIGSAASSTTTTYGLSSEWNADIGGTTTTSTIDLTTAGATVTHVAAGVTTPLALTVDPKAKVSGTLATTLGGSNSGTARVTVRRTDGVTVATAIFSTNHDWSVILHPGTYTFCGKTATNRPEKCWQGDVDPGAATPVVVGPEATMTGIAITAPITAGIR